MGDRSQERKKARSSARETALRTLLACQRQGAWSDGYLKKAIRRDGLDRRDAALCTRLCYGVLQNQMRLDWYLSRLSNTKLEQLELPVLCNLRLALYQLQNMDRVPESAAVNEAVALTRRYARNPRAAGLVNAVLRAYLRRREEFSEPSGGSWAETMSVRYSHPQWLVEEFCARLGEQETEQLLSANNREVPVIAQIDPLRTGADRVMESLSAQGVEAERHPWLADCLVLKGTGDLERLEAYQKGWILIQDAAAKLAALSLGALPGEKILDCCAAPGGKSFSLAICMENRGEVFSCDIHPNKLKLIEAGRDRLGLSIVQPVLQNGTRPRPEWAGAFDRVIADVPCSGLGIIRKKPDIRYKAPEPLERLPDVQLAILENNSGYVKPGGVLVYSTCTLLRRENEAVVERFLARHPEFRLERMELPGVGTTDGMVTLWPQRQGTDGFFIAKLKREGGTLCGTLNP